MEPNSFLPARLKMISRKFVMEGGSDKTQLPTAAAK